MEYLGGGEIRWRNEQQQPILQVDQCRRICRDVILGLEYCAWVSSFGVHQSLTILLPFPSFSTLSGNYPP